MQHPVLNNTYALDRVIGEGTTAKVFSAKIIATRQKVAIKFIKPNFLQLEQGPTQLAAEIKVMNHL